MKAKMTFCNLRLLQLMIRTPLKIMSPLYKMMNLNKLKKKIGKNQKRSKKSWSQLTQL